jgi:hypothetical protein
MTAIIASDPCEPEMKISARQISINNLRDMVSPETESGRILIVPYLFQFLEMGFDAFVISAIAWISWSIDLEGIRFDERPHRLEVHYRLPLCL